MKPYIRRIGTSDRCSIWLVDGFWVRNNVYIDFVEGGHGYVYPKFIPKNEIWIDQDVRVTERKYVILHEVCERRLMKQGASYSVSHKRANEVETRARRRL